MRKSWILIAVSMVVLLVAALALAARQGAGQVTAATHELAFDLLDADVVTSGVTRVEMQVDGGAWSSVGMPPKRNDPQTTLPGASTYAIALPILEGQHRIAVRACNPSLCSDPTTPLIVTLPTKPSTPFNMRIRQILGL